MNLGVQQSNALASVHQLLLSHFAASLCLFQSDPQLLNLSQHEAVPALHHGNLFLHVFPKSDSIVKVQLGILKWTAGYYDEGDIMENIKC